MLYTLGSVVQSSRRGLNSLRSYIERSKGNIFPASQAWGLSGSEHVCLSRLQEEPSVPEGQVLHSAVK